MPILVVEDDDDTRDLLCAVLRDRHDCTCVVTAEEGLALLPRKEFDVVIADLNLPGMSGLDMAWRVRELYPKVRVIVATGEAMDGRRWVGSGVYAYLMKPLDVDEVRRYVEMAIESGRASLNC